MKKMKKDKTKTLMAYCFGCSRKRECKIHGNYMHEGKSHNIYVCKYCRGWETRRLNGGDQ